MKHLISLVSTSFSVHLLLTACQPGNSISGKYVCHFDVKPDIWSYSIVMNFMPNGYVEIKYESKDPESTIAMPSEKAPYTLDGGVTIKSQSGDQIFKVEGNKLIGSGGKAPIGKECPKI
jgi:hypothetical protein